MSAALLGSGIEASSVPAPAAVVPGSVWPTFFCQMMKSLESTTPLRSPSAAVLVLP